MVVADGLTQSEKYDLAMRGEDARPDWVPDIEWHGKMSGPLAEFCTSMIASGHPDTEIQRNCEEWFGGPATVSPIRRLHDTHSAVIAEKVEELSQEMANIPIARKSYRMQMLNRMALQLMDKFHDEVPHETPANVEKLTRSVAKIVGLAREEVEGDTIRLEQHNTYIEAINNVDASELDDLVGELKQVHSRIQALSGGSEEDDEDAVDVDFEVEDADA